MERSPLAQRRLVEAWESGDPVYGASMSFNEWVRAMRRNERNGTGVVFAIEHHGRIVGQISLGAICYGAMRTGVVGYWVDERCAGRGYAPMAVTLLADWAMFDLPGRNCIVWRSTCFPKTNVHVRWHSKWGHPMRGCARRTCS